jgi:hypothetical protein
MAARAVRTGTGGHFNDHRRSAGYVNHVVLSQVRKEIGGQTDTNGLRQLLWLRDDRDDRNTREHGNAAKSRDHV